MQDVFAPKNSGTLIIHLWAALPVNLRPFTFFIILSPVMKTELLRLPKLVDPVLLLSAAVWWFLMIVNDIILNDFRGWSFKIIFTHIYSFNQRLKICIHNRWCFIRFLVLIKLYYLSVFRRHYNTREIFIFAYFFTQRTSIRLLILISLVKSWCIAATSHPYLILNFYA